MWWSPDSRKLAFYRFDESRVADYYVTLGQTRSRPPSTWKHFRPRARPTRSLTSTSTTSSAARRRASTSASGRPFDNSVVGHYVYHVGWSRDGRELIFFRTNRRQNVFELAAAEPGDWRHAGRPARRVADWLGQRRSPDRLSRRWTPLHLGIAAQRLEQLLSLRSRRPADRAAHVSHQPRSGDAGEGRRARRAAVLHRARRRQRPEAAAAPRRSRRQERSSADRSGVSPHGLAAASRRWACDSVNRHRRCPAASRRTTVISSTSTRRTTRRRRRGW